MRRPGKTIWVHNRDFLKIRQIELNMAFGRMWRTYQSRVCAKRELQIFNMLGASPQGSSPYGTTLGWPEHQNHENSDFSAARALKSPFKILRALRQRAIFKFRALRQRAIFKFCSAPWPERGHGATHFNLKIAGFSNGKMAYLQVSVLLLVCFVSCYLLL